MSEELLRSEEIETPQEIKKKTTKKKEPEIIENFQYIPGENEKLIMDKPSEPLINKEIIIPSELNKKDLIIMKPVKPVVKSNKELYESYVKELKYFSLSINNEILYDSSIDRTKDFPIKFENDFFILYGKKYSYNGLKIQKINKK